jgi:hypothetical protein
MVFDRIFDMFNYFSGENSSHDEFKNKNMENDCDVPPLIQNNSVQTQPPEYKNETETNTLPSEEDMLLETVLIKNYGWVHGINCNYEKNECIICIDNFKNAYILSPPCKHMFHRDCIITCIKVSKKYECPECNKKFVQQKMQI